ncbi:hypothetical protein Ancab_039735 [Ancistrocladus abbreviatus]
MGDERQAFYVVRKGDIVGIYKSLSDCQAQAGSSPLNPSITVYKGYFLTKEAEEHLVTHGLKNPSFSIAASELQDGLFGSLAICPFQDADGRSSCSSHPQNKNFILGNYTAPQAFNAPACADNSATKEMIHIHEAVGSSSFAINPLMKHVKLENYKDSHAFTRPVFDAFGSSSCSSNSENKYIKLGNYMQSQAFSPPVHASYSATAEMFQNQEAVGTNSFSANPQMKHLMLDNYKKLAFTHPVSLVMYCQVSCIIEFDGASKGNPGQAGAGAVLRAEDGSTVWRLREGVGIATNNVAEYRALLLGLKYAVERGFKHVLVRGDSLLVCKQVEGLWKTKNQNMADLCKEARKLKDKFTSFRVEHVAREFNSDADAQANLAITLKEGEVRVEVKNYNK